MKKYLFDLTENDIKENRIWYFSMLEGEDELLVQTPDDNMSEDSLKIVATQFFSNSGEEYIGYVYMDEVSIKNLKPVIVYGKKNLNFWKGIRRPNADILENIRLDFGENFFPVKFGTLPNEFNFLVNGEIDGIYYYDPNKKICCLRPEIKGF